MEKEVRSMNSFKVTKDHRILLNDVEIDHVLGFDLHIEAGKDPEVVLRVSAADIDIDDYRDYWYKS